ncbi:hypothetical protein GEMRC1_012890 [Eukaryota sp. GEM-RC1]
MSSPNTSTPLSFASDYKSFQHPSEVNIGSDKHHLHEVFNSNNLSSLPDEVLLFLHSSIAHISEPNQGRFISAVKEVQSLLNKLSESNKVKVFSDIAKLLDRKRPLTNSLSEKEVDKFRLVFVLLLFEQAVLEPISVDLYSQLCHSLTKRFEGFHHNLIDHCQHHFEKFFIKDTSISDEVQNELICHKKSNLITSIDKVSVETKLKARVLGNFRFVAALILHTILPSGVASVITKQLVTNYQKPMAIEGLITLWTKILESAGINDYIELVVAKIIIEFSTDLSIPKCDRDLCSEWVKMYHENQLKQALLRISPKRIPKRP